MRNHKKLYRSITASLLMLFAGLVLAPTVVTAGFHAATKKPVVPPQQTQQVALEPTAPKAAHKEREHSSRFAEPTAPAHDEQPAPQAETEPSGHGQHNGPTTFAIADFEPIHGHGAVFPRGGRVAGIEVAVASTGGNIAKVTRKPNPPTADNDDQSGNGQSDSSLTDDNQTDDAGTPDNNKSAGSTSPGASGDDKDHPATDNEQHDDKPADTQLADNTDHHDNSSDKNSESRPHVSVPEPSSIGLLAAGIIGLLLARRRS